MSNTYTCAMCKRTFNKGWTESEAEKELANNFPGFETDDCDLVCDDCYKELGLA